MCRTLRGTKHRSGAPGGVGPDLRRLVRLRQRLLLRLKMTPTTVRRRGAVVSPRQFDSRRGGEGYSGRTPEDGSGAWVGYPVLGAEWPEKLPSLAPS